jgi:hypothetical protein
MICCLCKRQTVPAAFIGPMAVGPRCARKAGLLGPKAPKGVRLAKPNKVKPCSETRDLFEVVA